MLFSQGDIVDVFFPLKQGDQPHPALIISNDNVNSLEEKYFCVMITGNLTKDEFSFFLDDKMTTKQLDKNSVIRLSLFSTFRDKEIQKKKSHLKREFLLQVLGQFNEVILQPQEPGF
jgi:mRNA-degrading endonuclease toxin of MazEF toxin-antitoxin module